MRYFHLEMEVPEALRGLDLAADDMDRLGARLIEYEARRISGTVPGAKCEVGGAND